MMSSLKFDKSSNFPTTPSPPKEHKIFHGRFLEDEIDLTESNKKADGIESPQENNRELPENVCGFESNGEVSGTESTTSATVLEKGKHHLLKETVSDNENGDLFDTSFNHTQEVEPEVIISTSHLLSDERVSLRTHLASMWYLAVVIIAPIVFLPIIFMADDKSQKQARCGYIIAVMAVYWTTECLPMAVTSLLPVVLLPMFGFLSARTTSAYYFSDPMMVFFGGLIVAIAIEVWNVHKRIALFVLKTIGAEPRRLLLGIMLVTWFLSMWISNTATTTMMLSIVQAMFEQFQSLNNQKMVQSQLLAKNNSSNNINERQTNNGGKESLDRKDSKRHSIKLDLELARINKAMCLTVLYAANIGGVATLTGTGVNLIFFAAAQKTFQDVGLSSPVTFTTWLVFGTPISLLLVIFVWLWMAFVFLRCRSRCTFGCCCYLRQSSNLQIQKFNEMIKEEYRKLGPITYAEVTVLVTFVSLVVSWVTRDLGGIGGWKVLFPAGYVSDSTPAIFFAILLFILPSSFPAASLSKCLRSGTHHKIRPLLTWKHIHEKMPWSIYFLVGAGYSLARAATDSGLSAWLGEQLLVFRNLNHWVILLIVCYIITFTTEILSNTATSTLTMPIVSQMAISLRLNPLFLMFPTGIAASFAFMLPVATSSNALVYATGSVKLRDMATSGFFLNCICVPILLFATATWGNAFFHFEHLPAEFLKNVTIV